LLPNYTRFLWYTSNNIINRSISCHSRIIDVNKAYTDNAAQATAIIPRHSMKNKEDEALLGYCWQWIAIAHMIEQKEESMLEHRD
jgi:hypothetical protein